MPKSDKILSYDLSKFPLGEDSKHTPKDDPFQLPIPDALFPQDGIPRLTEAKNVDIDDFGRCKRRKGLTVVDAVSTSGKNVFSGADLLLEQDGGTINSINISTEAVTPLVTSLSTSAKVLFHEHDGQVFWTNGISWGRVESDATAYNWGLAVPPSPTLTGVAGNLPAGRYRVSCVYTDSNYIMSGAPKATTITTNGSQDIQVSFTGNDSNASKVRVYCSFKDGRDLYFVKEADYASSFSTTITDIQSEGTSSDEYLETMHLSGPISGIEGISNWGGFLLIWNGKFIVSSAGNDYHLFDYRTDVFEQEFDILGMGGFDNGPLFVATDQGMYRYDGAIGDASLSRTRLDNLKYASGFKFLSGAKIGGLKSPSNEVLVFASEQGFAFCLPNGSIEYPLEDRVNWDVANKTASFGQVTVGDIDKIMVNLV